MQCNYDEIILNCKEMCVGQFYMKHCSINILSNITGLDNLIPDEGQNYLGTKEKVLSTFHIERRF